MGFFYFSELMISIPFSGTKKYSYKTVKEIVKDNGYKTVYEPFGGSCVLSVNLFNDGLIQRAVANDYDNFLLMYPAYLDLKDKVVRLCYEAGLEKTTHSNNKNIRITKTGKRIPVKSRQLQGKERETLQRIIKENVPESYWRHFSLGQNFAYSAVSSHEKIHLTDFCEFSSDLTTKKQRKYLKLLNKIYLEHLDYKDFYEKYKNSFDSKSLIILDPPYTGRSQRQYKNEFNDLETVDLIERTKKLNCDFILFNHDKEKMKRWLSGLDYEIKITGCRNNTANRNRVDVMAYVRNS